MVEEARTVVAVSFLAWPGMRPVVADVLRGVAEVVFLPDLEEASRAEVLEDAEVLLAWNPSVELRSEELAAARDLQFIQLISAGADHVPFADIPERITIASNAGAYAEPMAEHVVAMALALAKHLPQRHAELARGEFRQLVPNRSFAGSVCAILGFGGIGRATARRFSALGARVWAINTTGRTDEPVEFVGTMDDLGRLLEAADILVIALPLTKATRGLLGRRELSLMKPDAILVNVARGAIVEEAALFEHLLTHPEFMAGIDAWWQEPFGGGEFRIDFPFFDLPNVLGSPHNSAIVPGIQLEAARRAAENVLRHLRGESVAGVVRREDYEG